MNLALPELDDNESKMSRKLSTCIFDNLKEDVEDMPPDEDCFFWLFRVAGFGASSQRKWVSRAGFFFLTFVACTSIFELLYVLIHIVVHSKFSIKYASYPVSLGWMSHLTMNLILYYYFRYRNIFTSEFAEIIQIPGARRIIRNMKRLCLVLAVMVVFFSFCVLLATHFNNSQSMVFTYNDVFPYRSIAMAVRIMAYYKIFVVLVMEFYFLCFTGILCSAFNELNRKFKESLSSSKNTTNDETARLLHSFFLDHLRLSKKLRLLDKTYGSFALMYCVCTLPSTVFALWAMLVYASLMHYLVTELELLVSLTWIILLITNPIRIRSTVHDTKLLILSTMEIWEEYSEKVSDVARLFLTHLNEDQLGISIWGFVLITKSLILSFISITGTFLIFLVQTHYGVSALPSHLMNR